MSDIYDFLERVAQNNSRAWLAANRKEYDSLRAQWADNLQRLIDAMTTWNPGMRSQTPQSATYRFYRDTRFSLDKSPLKTYFSALLSPYGRKSPLAGYYIQVDCRENENGLYAGLWMPDAGFLTKMRHAIVDNIEEFEDILQSPTLKAHWAWYAASNTLKTAPKGWPKDHPQIEYLRKRDYGLFCQCDRDFFRRPDWPERAADLFRHCRPFVDFINYSLTEE